MAHMISNGFFRNFRAKSGHWKKTTTNNRSVYWSIRKFIGKSTHMISRSFCWMLVVQMESFLVPTLEREFEQTRHVGMYPGHLLGMMVYVQDTKDAEWTTAPSGCEWYLDEWYGTSRGHYLFSSIFQIAVNYSHFAMRPMFLNPMVLN
jgi:hypothetical protein